MEFSLASSKGARALTWLFHRNIIEGKDQLPVIWLFWKFFFWNHLYKSIIEVFHDIPIPIIWLVLYYHIATFLKWKSSCWLPWYILYISSFTISPLSSPLGLVVYMYISIIHWLNPMIDDQIMFHAIPILACESRVRIHWWHPQRKLVTVNGHHYTGYIGWLYSCTYSKDISPGPSKYTLKSITSPLHPCYIPDTSPWNPHFILITFGFIHCPSQPPFISSRQLHDHPAIDPMIMGTKSITLNDSHHSQLSIIHLQKDIYFQLQKVDLRRSSQTAPYIYI